MKKENKHYDHIIHCVTDAYKNNPLISNWVNYHTHGLSAKGFTELSVVAPEDDDRPADIINIIAELMVEGEEFDLAAKHFIDDTDGNVICTFVLLPVKCYGEDSLRIVLEDPDTNRIEYLGLDDATPYVLQFSSIFEMQENL